MTVDELFIRRSIVLASALVYWGGVWVQARRVRKRIGRSPNLKPRGFKEKLLWLGWFAVVAGWIALPLLAQPDAESPWLKLQSRWLGPGGLFAGLFLMIAGYAGTLWCYTAMGDHWRIGLDRRQKGALVNTGPYRVVRHPIYLFQMVMLGAVVLLLPTGLPLLLLTFHLVCALIKAWDEENHLLEIHGDAYRQYLRQTGMLLPPFSRRTRTSGSSRPRA